MVRLRPRSGQPLYRAAPAVAALLGLLVAAAPAHAFSANYRQALSYSLYFYNAQRSGPAPEGIPWRGDANMDDEVPGGWHDAGDSVKFNLPMASAATVLAWGALEFPDGYNEAGQMEPIIDVLTFVADYFVRCWDPKRQTAVVGIGDPFVDHRAWAAPEMVQYAIPNSRGVHRVSKASPGSDAVAEMAAALAAIGLLRKANGLTDNGFFKVAEQLLKFATAHQGRYSDANPIVESFYKSWSGYHDELAWAEIWLYKVDGRKERLSRSLTQFKKYKALNPGEDWETLDWDNKAVAVAILLNHLYPPAKEVVSPLIKSNRQSWLAGLPTAPGGIRFAVEWGSLRYAANQAFLAEISSKLAGGDSEWQKFSEQQINYILGNNPDKFSYVIGYGKSFPQNPHHRGAHGPFNNETYCCPDKTRHTLYGALVGGPTKPLGMGYEDDRGDYMSNEVAVDYNAGFSSTLAALISRKAPADSNSSYPAPQSEPGVEFSLESFDLGSSDTAMEVEIVVRQMTSWPARRSAIGFRYFFDMADDAEPSNLKVTIASLGGLSQQPSVSAVSKWSTGTDIYYVNIAWTKDKSPYPVGGNHIARLLLIFSAEDTSLAFDRSRDWSHPGRNQPNTPLYEAEQKVLGNLPDDTRQEPIKGGGKPPPRATPPPDMSPPDDENAPTPEEPQPTAPPADQTDSSSCSDVVWEVDQSWPGGFMIEVSVAGAISGTTMSWDWQESGVTIESSWNIEVNMDTGSRVSLTLMADTFGFVARTSNAESTKAINPENIGLNNKSCSEGEDDSEEPGRESGDDPDAEDTSDTNGDEIDGGGNLEDYDGSDGKDPEYASDDEAGKEGGSSEESDGEGSGEGEDGVADGESSIPTLAPEPEDMLRTGKPSVTMVPTQEQEPMAPDDIVDGVFPDPEKEAPASPTPRAGEGKTDDDDDGEGTGETEEENDDDPGSACFPASALVEVDGRGSVPISDLSIGDRVRTGPGANSFSPVFFFSHSDSEVESTFLRIRVGDAAMAPLLVSAGHYLIEGEVRHLKAASAIVVNDTLYCGISGKKLRVVDVVRVRQVGLYNPHTESGEIVVNGFQASVYTTAVHPWLAWLLLEPVRVTQRWGIGLVMQLPAKLTILSKILPSGNSIASGSRAM